MKENVKETLLKILIALRDMDCKSFECVSLIKNIPYKELPLDVIEFYIKEMQERDERIKRIKEISILIESK